MKAVKLAGAEVKAAGTALDMILDSRAMSIAEIGDQFGRGTKFERAIKSAGTRFGVVSLMAPWNAAMKQFSGMVVMNNLLRASEKVAKGQASLKEIRKLAAAGINSDLAERITKQFSKYGETQDGVLLAKAADWDDRLTKEAFRAAVVRDVDRIIVTPGQDKPLWMAMRLYCIANPLTEVILTQRTTGRFVVNSNFWTADTEKYRVRGDVTIVSPQSSFRAGTTVI